MEQILEKLYWVCEGERSHNENLSAAMEKFCEYKSLLTERLEGENLEIFTKLAAVAADITGIVERDCFVEGAKFGSKLMLELA